VLAAGFPAATSRVPQGSAGPDRSNLLGDPRQQVSIGSEVVGKFEHHTASEPPFSLLQ
jgi:hypothetical protein